MKRILIIFCISILVIIGLLAIPFFTKNRTSPLANFKVSKLSEFKYKEIEFVNKNDKIKLAGMLFLPEGKETPPLAIIIHGSGNSNRDNIWYLALTKGLLDKGIAVLLPDKRGSDKSKGNWVGKSIEELATDSESAIEFVKFQNDYKFSGVGIVGISQGGWIAPVVATKTKDLDFVINISGSVTTGEEQLLFEERNNISKYTYDFIAKFVAPFTTENLKNKKSVAPFVDFDPTPFWKKVNTPTLIAYGENDTNCPVELSLENIKQKGLNHVKVKTYKDGRHAILDESKTKISDLLFSDIEQFVSKSLVNKRKYQQLKK